MPESPKPTTQPPHKSVRPALFWLLLLIGFVALTIGKLWWLLSLLF